MKRSKDAIRRRSTDGMTLIEIIVALAIFAIMSVGFYGAFATIFINMYQSSQITENLFESQQLIEERIADVKLKLKNGLASEVTEDRESYVFFSGTNQRTVYAYHLTENMINGKVIETLVAENRPPQLEVPIINTDVIISAKLGSVDMPYPNIASKDSMSIGLKADVGVDNEGILIQYLYYWYMSKPGVYTVSEPPEFPDDYELLAGYTSKSINSIPASFGGRFFILLVTPVGEKGAMGTSVPSNALFISNLPVYDNLLLHYDASLINKSNPFEFDNINNRVLRWVDAGNLKLASNTPPSNKPTIESFVYGDEGEKETFGVSRSTMSTDQTLTSSKPNPQISKSNLTVYLVMNFDSVNGTAASKTILHSRSGASNTKFILRTSTTGQLELVRYSDNGSAFVVTNQSDYRTDEWDIIKLEIYTTSSGGISIRRDVQKNSDTFSFNSNQTSSSTNNNLTLTPFSLSFAHGYSIGEVMIYDGITSSEDENLILEYLYDKYYP